MSYTRPVSRQIVMNVPGVLQVGLIGSRWYNQTGASLTISGVSSSVGTPSAGAPIIAGLYINGVNAFPGGTGRPSIPAGSYLSSTVVPGVVVVPIGGYLTVEVAQIGSTQAGSDLLVMVVF